MEPREFEILRKPHIPIVASRTVDGILSHITEHPSLIVSLQLGYCDLANGPRVEPSGSWSKLRVVGHTFLDSDFA